MYACAGATHSAILRCCRTVEPLGLAFRQCSLYPHTHFSLHLSRGLMTGQPGTFLPCYVPWYWFPSQVRQGDSSAALRLVDSLQRLLRAHAVAVVDANDLHVHKLFHKVPLFRLFGVKVMFLIQNLLLFVNLFIFMGVPCLFPARNLVWLTVSPEEALASGKGACNSGIWENRKVVAVYRARNFGCSCRGAYDPWSHEQDTAIPVMTLRSPQI